jgi:hypothetical protein
MQWQTLINADIQAFIRNNDSTDTAKLALNKNLPEPRTLILDQIKSRQKAARKMPNWLEIENIIFPSPATIEQASSEPAAIYKASLTSGKNFIDLTGGSGIDSFALASRFESGHIIERDPETAAILAHNAFQFGFKHLHIHTGNAEDILPALPAADLVYIDPQRRNTGAKGLYKLAECSPSIVDLMPILTKKTKILLIKKRF